jgi:ribonucleoside-diphosphate reductase alpha chain
MVQAAVKPTNALHELGYKIFLDRYALKDMKRKTLQVGDLVIVVVNPQTGQREIGKVTALALPKVTIELLDGEVTERDIEHVDKPLETDPGQMMDRVAKGIAAVEKNPKLRKQWAERFRWLMDDFKFVPAGRILAAAGTNQDLTFYNCMPPEQEILTADGYKPLGEVRVGDLVVTHRNRLRPVLHKFERETEEPIYIIKPRKLGFDDLHVTGDHKIHLIRSEWINKHRSRDGLRLSQQPDWIPAKEVRVGDFVAVAYNGEECPPEPIQVIDYLPESAYQVREGKVYKATTRGAHGYVQDWGTHFDLSNALELDEDLCYMLGRWLGDGCITHRTKSDIPSGIKIVFALDEKAEADHIAEIITRKLGIPAVVKMSSTGRWYDLWANSMPLGQFFKAFLGAYSYGKRIPDVLMHMPKSLTIALLRGLFSADGYTSRNQLGIVLSNRVMATQVHQLLLKLGYLFSIKENTHRLGKHPAYRIQATANECGDLFQAFFDRPAPPVEMDTKHYIEYDGLRWVRIDEIALADYSGVVMDIEVAEDHSFVSAGVVVSNCYVISSPHDSRAGIIKTLSEMTEIMSRGGGVGINISSLRPRHSYVKGVNGRSSGSVSWGALYSFVTGLIEQGGSRRGALMVILNDWHPDVFDFINSKRQAGQITNANISVNVSDKLMAAIKADDDWELMFPDTGDPKYDSDWNGDLDGWRASGGKVISYRTVKAREVWNAIIESAWASAEPGLWFGERSNKESNSSYFNPLICTNPCTTGDTLVATEFGYTKARDLQPGMKIRTPAGLKPIEKVYNNGVQRIFRVEFSDGGHLECTADHKLKVVRGKKYEWVAVNELQTGDRVLVMPNESFGSMRRLPEEVIKHIQRRELKLPDFYDRTMGFLAGVVIGDGTFRRVRSRNGFAYQCKIAFGVNEPEWFEKVQDTIESIGVYTHQTLYSKDVALQNGTMVKHQSQQLDAYKLGSFLAKIGMEPNVKAPQKQLPEHFLTLDREFLASILDGLFCTDGGIDMSRSNPLLRFHTSSKKLAEQVRLILLQFGIHARIYPVQRKRDLTYDGRSMYGTGVKYDVVIMNEGIPRFYSEIGLSHPQKAARLKDVAENWHYNGGTWIASVTSIEDTGRDEEVFDVYEPETLTWITNGYVSFDCGEQSLGAYSVCNLGAINLAKFYDEEAHDVNWELLDTAVRYATRFLDNVIDATPYFFEENERVQKGERRVGLNNMGLAELLIKLELRYGSPESIPLIDKLYAFIARASYETSIELAQEKGAFPEFDGEKFVQSGFMQKMPADIRERVRKDGIRNVTLLTQAPNGTTGTLVNTSTGIEPFFSWKYYRKSRLGLHEENVPIAQEWLNAHPDETELPDYFATAMELAPEDHARVQAAIQRWVDSSISKTSNLPNNYTVEQVGEFYELLYDLGCKGGTVYRDGSRSEQVLMLKGDERAESEMKDNEKAKSAPAQEQVATPHRVYPRPKKLTGVTVNTPTPYGTSYITMNSDENGYPFEVFITAPGKAGSDLQADAEGLGRMISLQLRTTAPQNRMTMLRLIIDQLQGIGGSRTVGFGPSRVLSLPDALAAALLEQYFSEEKVQQLDLFNAPALPVSVPVETSAPPAPVASNGNGHHNPNGAISGATLCPSCGTISLVRAEGCRKCLSCGYSEC